MRGARRREHGAGAGLRSKLRSYPRRTGRRGGYLAAAFVPFVGPRPEPAPAEPAALLPLPSRLSGSCRRILNPKIRGTYFSFEPAAAARSRHTDALTSRVSRPYLGRISLRTRGGEFPVRLQEEVAERSSEVRAVYVLMPRRARVIHLLAPARGMCACAGAVRAGRDSAGRDSAAARRVRRDVTWRALWAECLARVRTREIGLPNR